MAPSRVFYYASLPRLLPSSGAELRLQPIGPIVIGQGTLPANIEAKRHLREGNAPELATMRHQSEVQSPKTMVMFPGATLGATFLWRTHSSSRNFRVIRNLQ